MRWHFHDFPIFKKSCRILSTARSMAFAFTMNQFHGPALIESANLPDI